MRQIIQFPSLSMENTAYLGVIIIRIMALLIKFKEIAKNYDAYL